MISSKAALWGSTPGLSAYGAAKGAVLGLTRQLAAEGAPDGIGVNAVFPTAITMLTHPRMAEVAADLGEKNIEPADLAARSAALVAAVVAWLCHPDCDASGQFFKAQAGQAQLVSFAMNPGIERARPLARGRTGLRSTRFWTLPSSEWCRRFRWAPRADRQGDQLVDGVPGKRYVIILEELAEWPFGADTRKGEVGLTATEERRDSKVDGHVAVPIVDTDTHVIEPYDLWTSRADAKYRAQMPRVEEDPDGVPRWKVGDRWLTAPARYACAGLPKYPPYKPSRFEEVVPESFKPEERIRWMDQEGIYAACLYPNLVAFDTYVFMTMEDANASLEAVRIYNDYLVDLAKTAPGRLLPITMVPFWDRDGAVAEIKRCHDLGHSGVLWANKFELVELPSFVDEYWDPDLRRRP